MSRSQHKITALRSGSHPTMGDWEAEHEITFKFYRHSGSRDFPPEPPEVEFISISPGAGDHGAFSDLAQKDLEDWAADWLEDHEDDAIERAMSDLHADDDAREEARNNGQFGMGA